MMVRKILIISLALLLCLVLSACKHKEKESVPETMPGTEFRHDATLTVSAPNGSVKARFEVEIAATPEATMQGLMYREEMAPDHGMLFDPEGLSNTYFWMKNTYMPLDIIFIDADQRVLNIARDTVPFSTEQIKPDGIYRYVLEINAGLAQKHDIDVGDKIEWTTD